MNAKDLADRPYITQEEKVGGSQPQSLVRNLSDGAELIYRSFYLPDATTITVAVRGQARGVITLIFRSDSEKYEQLKIDLPTYDWEEREISFSPYQKTFDLTLRYEGEGTLDIKELKFN
ncbi:hypothetical protein SAMN04488100_10419 [Alkalibacterium putridalgicola]|uniref:Uncharacterized protein n=1 Tax=Alkalibacterium putridalgicola TaxID=426703 RepID=A0A1H7RA47_9LACT|nr:hypothetical protein [Alkalibacterium putridalgicola]GEK88842.1 hypothetical protein APU01nite_08810 [Alkalibacterium putridalgicola]SEL57022.1 hypothetical protein SAMN04488100_10419 [Alkalibacterium putridalgicola]